MTQSPKVVIYGASGYTGKLIAESLARIGIPFVAAGRSEKSLKLAMAEVPGVEQLGVRIAEVPHESGALHDLFSQAQIVINVVGPFGQLGRPVVESALKAGCHYLDTTGEQDWVITLRDQYDEAYGEQNLVLCAACSWMWVGGQLAAEECLETPGIDSLDILYAPRGAATIASTLSFMRMINRDQFRLVDNQLETWPAATILKVAMPHTHEIVTAFPWGGGCEPVWYDRDARVRNCRVAVAFPNEPGVDWLVDYMKQYQESAKTLSNEELEELTNGWGLSWAKTPGREVLEVNRCVVMCKSRGNTTGRTVTHFATSPYLQTGVMQAEAVRQLLAGEHLKGGFASPVEAFGAKKFIEALAEENLHAASL